MNMPDTHGLKGSAAVPELSLAIEYMSVALLQADPQNARRHGKRQEKALDRSIRTFGFVTPVIADASNMLIAGHARLAAAKRLGVAKVPVVRLEHLDEPQRRALMIADNRLTDLSDWDDALLAENLRLLCATGIDIDPEVTGFSMGEIDLRIELADDAVDDNEDDIPVSPVSGLAVSAVGDLWLLGDDGRHRLMCGNALDTRVWSRLMDGKKAHMGLTDVPYNVPINGHVSGLGRIRHREFVMAAGEMTREEFTDFLASAFRNMAASSVAGSLHYSFIDHRHLGEMLSAGAQAFTEQVNLCVWAKTGGGGMGSLYRSAHELIFVWKSGKGRHRNNVELGRNGRNRTNVWTYPGVGTFRHSDEGDLLALHSTPKPVRMLADAILDVTARGQIVLDPFMGSGSTLIAAERVGRRAYGIELDPLYADTIIRRFIAHSGEKVVHASTGVEFSEVEASVMEAARG